MKDNGPKKYIKICQKSGCVSASYHSGENEETIYFPIKERESSGKFKLSGLLGRKIKGKRGRQA